MTPSGYTNFLGKEYLSMTGPLYGSLSDATFRAGDGAEAKAGFVKFNYSIP